MEKVEFGNELDKFEGNESWKGLNAIFHFSKED